MLVKLEMAGKAKAGSEALKDAKIKGKKVQTAVSSSENSELEASELKTKFVQRTAPCLNQKFLY